MTDHSPESIEAIPSSDIIAIKNLADELHDGTAGILDTPLHSAEIERQLRLRSAMKLKIDECNGWLKSQMADLEGVLRDMRTKKGYATTDEDRIESYFFNRLREEKRGQS